MHCSGGWSLEEHRKAERERKRLEKEEEERRQAEANMVSLLYNPLLCIVRSRIYNEFDCTGGFYLW